MSSPTTENKLFKNMKTLIIAGIPLTISCTKVVRDIEAVPIKPVNS